jgi:hypothetical protein
MNISGLKESTMDPNALRDHLTTLHEELRSAPRAAPGSSQLLGELMEDIQRLLARTPAADATPTAQPAPATPEHPSSLPERLEKLAVLFEVDHPTLAASSRRLVDLLGKVGL